jgi:hypothetical protein
MEPQRGMFSEKELADLGFDLLFTFLGAFLGMLIASLLGLDQGGNPFREFDPLLLSALIALVVFALLVLKRIGMARRAQRRATQAERRSHDHATHSERG